ncbi:hypothetical protein IscW_ISCW001716, partial [Ixodes scapularis]
SSEEGINEASGMERKNGWWSRRLKKAEDRRRSLMGGERVERMLRVGMRMGIGGKRKSEGEGEASDAVRFATVAGDGWLSCVR